MASVYKSRADWIETDEPIKLMNVLKTVLQNGNFTSYYNLRFCLPSSLSPFLITLLIITFYTEATLIVEVIEGQRMKNLDAISSDFYCVLTIQGQTQQTKVCGNTLQPKWNQTFGFTLIHDIYGMEIQLYLSVFFCSSSFSLFESKYLFILHVLYPLLYSSK